MTPKIDAKPTHMEVNNLQRKASIPLCVSIVLDVKTGGEDILEEGRGGKLHKENPLTQCHTIQ